VSPLYVLMCAVVCDECGHEDVVSESGASDYIGDVVDVFNRLADLRSYECSRCGSEYGEHRDGEIDVRVHVPSYNPVDQARIEGMILALEYMR